VTRVSWDTASSFPTATTTAVAGQPGHEGREGVPHGQLALSQGFAKGGVKTTSRIGETQPGVS
jgi:hypothetical protein